MGYFVELLVKTSSKPMPTCWLVSKHGRATMGVHSIHIFDRKGKTLFTKTYGDDSDTNGDQDQLSEQRKLIFGMVYSLKDIVSKTLSPSGGDPSLHTIQTGASSLHVYETASGLRFCLYTTPIDHQVSRKIRAALHHAYQDLWIQCVTRSPLYNPTSPNVKETNFESSLDSFLQAQPWFV